METPCVLGWIATPLALTAQTSQTPGRVVWERISARRRHSSSSACCRCCCGLGLSRFLCLLLCLGSVCPLLHCSMTPRPVTHTSSAPFSFHPGYRAHPLAASRPRPAEKAPPCIITNRQHASLLTYSHPFCTHKQVEAVSHALQPACHRGPGPAGAWGATAGPQVLLLRAQQARSGKNHDDGKNDENECSDAPTTITAPFSCCPGGGGQHFLGLSRG